MTSRLFSSCRRLRIFLQYSTLPCLMLRSTTYTDLRQTARNTARFASLYCTRLRHAVALVPLRLYTRLRWHRRCYLRVVFFGAAARNGVACHHLTRAAILATPPVLPATAATDYLLPRIPVLQPLCTHTLPAARRTHRYLATTAYHLPRAAYHHVLPTPLHLPYAASAPPAPLTCLPDALFCRISSPFLSTMTHSCCTPAFTSYSCCIRSLRCMRFAFLP